MRRRDFIKTTAGGAAAAAILPGCSGDSDSNDGRAPGVSTRESVRWRLVSSFPRSLDTLFGAVEVLSRRVRSLTNDRFQIRSYPAGEVVPATGVLGAVQNGTVQMGHTAGYYYTGHNPALAFDTCVPFGLTARQQVAWLYQGGGMDVMREVFSDFNVINFPGGNTGAQMGGWFRRPVESLSDLRGVKMRIPGLGGEVMSELGVTVQLLPGGEIYQALERGTIDAAEWVGPYDDVKLGFHEIATHYYYPGWWEPGPNLSFIINQGAWDSLPSLYQYALEVAAEEANLNMLALYDARNQEALQTVLDEGVQLHRFSDEIMQSAERISFDMMYQKASADAGYRKVYESFRQWREDSFRWFRTSEHAYADFAFPMANPTSQPRNSSAVL